MDTKYLYAIWTRVIESAALYAPSWNFVVGLLACLNL